MVTTRRVCQLSQSALLDGIRSIRAWSTSTNRPRDQTSVVCKESFRVGSLGFPQPGKTMRSMWIKTLRRVLQFVPKTESEQAEHLCHKPITMLAT